MRGKGLSDDGHFVAYRITPAYAGKSFPFFGIIRLHWDHPRICGEKQVSGLARSEPGGSPPHMRGKARPAAAPTSFFGITPAYAGKSRWKNTAALLSRDHPRICGEKSLPPRPMRAQRGSPPRMRGKVTATPANAGATGITPAYAGKRLKRSRSTVPPVAIVPLFPSVCNKPVVSDGSPAGRDAPLFLPAENAVPASPAYNLRSL